MTKKLVIFGADDIAQLAHFYFSKYSDYEVIAFAVDPNYLTETSFCGLPVISFEDVAEKYPPNTYDLFIALGYSQLNALRKNKFLAARKMGYHLPSFISPDATVLNEDNIGENCFILENNTIQPFATIGNNVTLWSGSMIAHHAIIKDHCFIASHVVVSGGVEIGERCFVGANATLRDHIKVGEQCVIGAGTLLLSDAESGGVYIGTETIRSEVPSSKLRQI